MFVYKVFEIYTYIIEYIKYIMKYFDPFKNQPLYINYVKQGNKDISNTFFSSKNWCKSDKSIEINFSFMNKNYIYFPSSPLKYPPYDFNTMLFPKQRIISAIQYYDNNEINIINSIKPYAGPLFNFFDSDVYIKNVIKPYKGKIVLMYSIGNIKEYNLDEDNDLKF